MKIKLTGNRQFIIGSILMFMPLLFFFAVFAEQVLHLNYFTENIFGRLDRINMAITVFMLTGLPAIAALVNLRPLVNIEVRKEGSDIKGKFSFTVRKANMIMIGIAAATLAVVAVYVLAESYRHP